MVEFWVHPETTQVSATRVVHLETRDVEAWPGWHPRRLVRFLRAYARSGQGAT